MYFINKRIFIAQKSSNTTKKMFFRKKKSGEADSQKEERAAGSNSNFDRSKTYATISLTEPIASSQFILPAHTTTSQQQTNNYWTNSSSDVLGLSTTSLTNYSDESVDFLRFNGGNTVLQQQKVRRRHRSVLKF